MSLCIEDVLDLLDLVPDVVREPLHLLEESLHGLLGQILADFVRIVHLDGLKRVEEIVGCRRKGQ